MKPNKRKNKMWDKYLLEYLADYNGLNTEHGFCDNSAKPYVMYLLWAIAGSFLGMIWFVNAFGMA